MTNTVHKVPENDSYKEYTFQLVVKRDHVTIVAENGAEFDYPRDVQGVKQIVRFIVGTKPKKAATRHLYFGTGGKT